MEACSLLVNLRKGMQGSSEQLLVGEECYVTTLIMTAKETTTIIDKSINLCGIGRVGFKESTKI